MFRSPNVYFMFSMSNNPTVPENSNQAEYFEKIAQQAVTGMKENLQFISKEFLAQANSFLDTTVKKYLEVHAYKNAMLKTLLHRIQPVYFFDIYQPTALKFDSVITEPKTLDDVFSVQHLITIIGEAGSGKSMFARYLFLTAIKEANQIPITVELRYLELYDKTLFQYICENIFETSNRKAKSIIEGLLKYGNFLIIMDGFDEISGPSASKIKDSISKFTDDYPHNYYILSSRPYANAEIFPGFANYSICPMNNAQLESFIRRQKIGDELAENAIRSIKEEKNNVLTSFVQNPLLLSLYLLTYKGNSNIPAKKSIFYRRVIDTLFREHDILTKFGFERPLKSKLNQEQIETILEAFSFISYCAGKFGFTKDYVTDLMTVIKRKKMGLEFSTPFLLDDLRVSISLWIEDGNDLYFTHRSLQEYFAVMYVHGIKTQNETIYKIIQEKICTKGAINESKNFLELLYEVEEYYFNRFLLLPNLEKITGKLADDSPWTIIKIFLKRIGVILQAKGVSYKLTRVGDTYAFIFDIIDFEFVRAFEAFLLGREMQDYFSAKATQAVLMSKNHKQELLAENVEPNMAGQLEIDLNSDNMDEFKKLFDGSEKLKHAGKLLAAKIVQEIIAVKKNVGEYSLGENLAADFFISG